MRLQTPFPERPNFIRELLHWYRERKAAQAVQEPTFGTLVQQAHDKRLERLRVEETPTVKHVVTRAQMTPSLLQVFATEDVVPALLLVQQDGTITVYWSNKAVRYVPQPLEV